MSNNTPCSFRLIFAGVEVTRHPSRYERGSDRARLDRADGKYRNPNQQKADQLNAQASATFDQGNSARDNADHYVRDTVLFATVLFLVAIAQRFTILPARIALAVLAGGLLVYLAISLVRLPRLS